MHYHDDPALQAMGYLDRYKKTRTAIQFSAILTVEGKVENLSSQDAPNDLVEVIGRRLPDELYHYLAKGTIGPRILNVTTSGTILELPPLDGGYAEDYHKLVMNDLTELRMSALSLLARSNVHRYYQYQDVILRCWFDKGNPKTLVVKEAPDLTPQVRSWNVTTDVFESSTSLHKSCELLGITTLSLSDNDLISTSTRRDGPRKPLQQKDEILFNTLWRFLHVRGYLDAQHRFTAWGNVLHSAMSALHGKSQLEEPVFLAIELARLGRLTADFIFHDYNGAPIRGSDTDQRNCLLISRVACFGKLRHKAIGFTGPLSRHLLAYHSMIKAVRNSLRDLVEVVLANMLLTGDADRDRKDLTEIGLE